ncbi:MAG: pyridoxamine 5-phosphate oxidase [Polyangiaceae bacterium]|jgi:pyridoxamine 5'-phosphate oxidase|nr:pyridoxamine 5-phosphate oxidase [Polyangiaceae bacterium]
MAHFHSDAQSAAPGADPLLVLQRWYEEAQANKDPLPDAMTLATASSDARPSARIVLFKGILRGGIFFVTNYQSRKARDLEENPRAALVLHFPTWERQVRVEGRVERTAPSESEAYFQSRPRGSQLGAWASPQSQPITSRAEIEARSQEVEHRFEHSPVTRPEFWGGYLVIPEVVELWLGRADRLHDRFVYRRDADANPWRIERLAP